MWMCVFLVKREYNVIGKIQVEDEQGYLKGTMNINENGIGIDPLISEALPSMSTWREYSCDQKMNACLDVIRNMDGQNRIDTSRIKEITGGDRMYARNLFESRGDDASFKYIIGEGERESRSEEDLRLSAEANLRHLLGAMTPAITEQPNDDDDAMPPLEEASQAIYMRWSRDNGQTWSDPILAHARQLHGINNLRGTSGEDDEVPELVENFTATTLSDVPLSEVSPIITGHIHQTDNQPEMYIGTPLQHNSGNEFDHSMLLSLSDEDTRRFRSVDEAIRRRIQVMPFQSTWTAE